MGHFTTGRVTISPDAALFIINNHPNDNICYQGYNLRNLLKTTNEHDKFLAGYCKKTHQFIYVHYDNARFRDDSDECMICFDPLRDAPCVKLHNCNHSMHYRCYREMVKTCKKNRYDVRCPMCKTIANEATLHVDVNYVRCYAFRRTKITEPCNCFTPCRWFAPIKYNASLVPTNIMYKEQIESMIDKMHVSDTFPSEILTKIKK